MTRFRRFAPRFAGGSFRYLPDSERTDPPLPPTQREFFGISLTAEQTLALGLRWGRVAPGRRNRKASPSIIVTHWRAPTGVPALIRYHKEKEPAMGASRGSFCDGCRGELESTEIGGVRVWYCPDCEPDVAKAGAESGTA